MVNTKDFRCNNNVLGLRWRKVEANLLLNRERVSRIPKALSSGHSSTKCCSSIFRFFRNILKVLPKILNICNLILKHQYLFFTAFMISFYIFFSRGTKISRNGEKLSNIVEAFRILFTKFFPHIYKLQIILICCFSFTK